MANHGACPLCGAKGFCLCADRAKMRNQAWNWYCEKSLVADGALAVHFRQMAEKVKQGRGDDRLHDILSEQQDYDLGRT